MYMDLMNGTLVTVMRLTGRTHIVFYVMFWTFVVGQISLSAFFAFYLSLGAVG